MSYHLARKKRPPNPLSFHFVLHVLVWVMSTVSHEYLETRTAGERILSNQSITIKSCFSFTTASEDDGPGGPINALDIVFSLLLRLSVALQKERFAEESVSTYDRLVLERY